MKWCIDAMLYICDDVRMQPQATSRFVFYETSIWKKTGISADLRTIAGNSIKDKLPAMATLRVIQPTY